MLNASSSPAVPRLAATTMLVREPAAGAAFEVWLAKRSLQSRFMPGASVFPGGAVDAADFGPLAREATVAVPSDDDARIALRHAALRELFEEAGVLLVCAPGGTPAAAPAAQARLAMRCALREGKASLDAMLVAAGLRLDARTLLPYSNWITPASEPIRFDTHFFLARAPLDHEAEADAHELHDGTWATPHEALADADTGKIVLTFPTRAHVLRLAEFDTLEALFAHTQERVIRPLEVALGDVFDPERFATVAW